MGTVTQITEPILTTVHSAGNNRGRRSAVRPDLYIKGLAKKCGVSDGYMSWVVSGKRNPSMKLAAKMAAALNKTITELAKEFGWTSLRGTIFFDEKLKKKELGALKK